MALDLSGFPIGSKVTFRTGPSRVLVTAAEVTGHDNGFVISKDSSGKVRKARPGACTLA